MSSWTDAVAKFPHSDRAIQDIKHVLELYPSITTYQEQKDESSFSNKHIFLTGTLPISFRQSNYNIPIYVTITPLYPMSPPIPFVRPTETMLIRPSQHVDPQGRVYHPYLAQWQTSSTLKDILSIMQTIFGIEPPVYAKPPRPSSMNQGSSSSSIITSNQINTSSMVLSAPSKPIQITQQQQQRHPSMSDIHSGSPSTPFTPHVPPKTFLHNNYSPSFNNESDLSISYSNPSPPHKSVHPIATYLANSSSSSRPTTVSNIARTQYNVNPTNHDVNNIKKSSSSIARPSSQSLHLLDDNSDYISSMKNLAVNKVYQTVLSEHEKLLKEMDCVMQDNNKLNDGSKIIDQSLIMMDAEDKKIDASIASFTEKSSILSKAIKEIKDFGEFKLDDHVLIESPVHQQLFTVVAEDHAIDDTIYQLNRALTLELIDLSSFLKYVRILAREQYFKRALASKIQAVIE